MIFNYMKYNYIKSELNYNVSYEFSNLLLMLFKIFQHRFALFVLSSGIFLNNNYFLCSHLVVLNPYRPSPSFKLG